MSLAQGSSFKLLDSQRNAAALLIDVEHLAFHFGTFFHDLAGMADFAGPRHIADVQQAVDSLFQLNERTVVGEVANTAFDKLSLGIAVDNFGPGILLCLLHTERDFLLLLVDFQNDDINRVIHLDQFVRMADPLGPRHFADMNQTFDAIFQFDKGTVAHHVDNSSLVRGIDGVFLTNIFPRACLQLLKPQGDFFLLIVDMKNLHFEIVVDFYHLGRVTDSSPTHVGDMQQAINATQVDKCSEVGDILDNNPCEFDQPPTL